jgi:hypothetical protein
MPYSTYQSFDALVRSAYGIEADTQIPLLDSVRAQHGMTVFFDDRSGDSVFVPGFHGQPQLPVGEVMFYFPPD